MPGKKIIGSGSTENKVIRLADHVAGLAFGGGGLPRFIESGVIGAVNFKNVGHEDGLERETVSLLTGSQHYREVIHGENPVFEQALNANDVFYTGFSSIDDYLEFVKSSGNNPLWARYLLNSDLKLTTSIKKDEFPSEHPMFSVGVCVVHSRKTERFGVINHLKKLADIPCVTSVDLDGFIVVHGGGSHIVNIQMADMLADPFAFGDGKPMFIDGFAGFALTVELRFSRDSGLGFGDQQEMRKKITVRGEPHLFGLGETDHNYFKLGVFGPELNNRYVFNSDFS
ncbi:hypothetical protein [Vibrio metschnikovii]|uniref:hypothetical protein n=1 Tax=Vibrio metschnikovii TaxID=28172 RepID=UPI001C2F3B2A|nr:hypothetical protein [Vibrio metschnikovii]